MNKTQITNMEPEKKCCLCHRERGTVPVNCECACHVPEKKDVWGEFDFFTKDMVIGILSGDKNSPVFVNNDLEMPRLKNFIRQNFIPRAEVVEKIEKKQKLFNFIPQDKNGYKMVKASDLNLLDLLTQEK